MKIAIFTDSYLPTVDGVVTSVLTTRRQLEADGHEVIVFAPEDPKRRVQDDTHTILVRAHELRHYPGYRLAIYPGREVDQVKELGVDVIWKGPQKEDDRAQQITVVEDFISRGVDGIVLAPLDDRALVRPVQAAVRRFSSWSCRTSERASTSWSKRCQRARKRARSSNCTASISAGAK